MNIKYVRILAVFVTAILMLPVFLVTATAETPGITVEVNGFRVDFEGQQPANVGGRTLVPVRGVFEELGFAVEWEVYAPRTVTLTNENYTVHITVGESAFTTNGAEHLLDVPAQIIGGSTMLPLRAVLESVGLHLYWFDWRQTVSIRETPLAVPMMNITPPAIWPEHLSDTSTDPEMIPLRNEWMNDFILNFFPRDLVIREYGMASASWSSRGSTDHRNVTGREELANFSVHLTDDTLWAWGLNGNGQLGDGTTEQRDEPVLILDSVFWASGAIEGRRGIALRYDGTLWTWGTNHTGQLGDGTTESMRTRPAIVLDNVVAAGGSSNHSLALRADGTLWSWGWNSSGRLGDGTTENRHSPGMIMDDVVSFSYGFSGGLALRADNSLWAWGSHHGEGGVVFDSPEPMMVARDYVSPEDGVFTFTADDGTVWNRFHFQQQLHPTTVSGS